MIFGILHLGFCISGCTLVFLNFFFSETLNIIFFIGLLYFHPIFKCIIIYNTYVLRHHHSSKLQKKIINNNKMLNSVQWWLSSFSSTYIYLHNIILYNYMYNIRVYRLLTSKWTRYSYYYFFFFFFILIIENNTYYFIISVYYIRILLNAHNATSDTFI